MGGSEIEFINKAFSSNYVAPLGPQLNQFEASVSEYLGDELHCVGLSSGSAALHLALRLAGVGPGSSVWISSMTFAGGIFPISYLGGIPRLFDLNEQTWLLDLNLVERELEVASRNGTLPDVLLPTDLYGQSIELCQVEALGQRFGVKVIVDSAESLGASVGRRMAGSGGDASILSFNGNKIITTSGGGMLVTKHEAWASEARFLATQARDPAPHYEHSVMGYNYRMSNVLASIGLGQMQVLEDRVSRRRAIFEQYAAELSPLGFQFMPELHNARSTRWLTTVVVDPQLVGVTREDIRLSLLNHQIESRPLWKPMHMQPLYSHCEYVGSGVDESLFMNGLCLPSGSDMTVTQQNEVIERIKHMVSHA